MPFTSKSITSSALRAPYARMGFDVAALLIVFGGFVFFVWGFSEISAPLSALHTTTISLAPNHLPEYALRTTLRMLVAVFASLIFTLTYATLAAKSKKAGQILIPVLDILQSVPVLGYISFTVTGFLALFPGSMLGVECAAIFAIFTSQAWNMAFSFYQSLRTIPRDMEEAALAYQLSGWQKFWRVEVPYAMPGLIWNMMMSMSGGWFFVVASEAIQVGNKQFMLPGIGSYISVAIEQQDTSAIGYAIAAMAVVILLYDQLLFRPLVAWSDKFRYEMSAGQIAPNSWVLTLFSKSRLLQRFTAPLRALALMIVRLPFLSRTGVTRRKLFTEPEARIFDRLWYVGLVIFALMGLSYLGAFFKTSLTLAEVQKVLWLDFLTLVRVMVLIAIASVIWVPIGVLVGLKPRWAAVVQPLAQFLAAFPANLLFPIAVIGIHKFHLNPDIWLSPLMILGTQWYILFNVIAGASAYPNDLREVTRNLGVKGWLWWWRAVLPGILPHYLTGVIVAYGGAWNASIVSEVVSWGNEHYTAQGLGAYIAQATATGNLVHTGLGIGVMALTVVVINRVFWKPLYEMAERKLRFD